MWPMLQALDPLLGTSPFGFFETPEGERTYWRRPLGQAGVESADQPTFDLTNARKPVAVIIGRRTASSGEMVALAFRARDDARLFGQPTAGFATANATHILSDGAALVLTEAYAGSRDGRRTDGRIYPETRLYPNEVRTAAKEWLSARCGSRPQARTALTR